MGDLLDEFKEKNGGYVAVRIDAIGIIYNKAGIAGMPLPRSLRERLPILDGRRNLFAVIPAYQRELLLWAHWVLQHPQLGNEFLEKLRQNNVLVVGQTRANRRDPIARGARIFSVLQQEHEFVKVQEQGVGCGLCGGGFSGPSGAGGRLGERTPPQCCPVIHKLLDIKRCTGCNVTRWLFFSATRYR